MVFFTKLDYSVGNTGSSPKMFDEGESTDANAEEGDKEDHRRARQNRRQVEDEAQGPQGQRLKAIQRGTRNRSLPVPRYEKLRVSPAPGKVVPTAVIFTITFVSAGIVGVPATDANRVPAAIVKLNSSVTPA